MYVGGSATGHVHAPKMVFKTDFLGSDLENYAIRKANAMYA
jgi:hypothetical protein